MNYGRHYESLIARARVRELVGYRERHHVIPRCMGGSDESSNIVALTAEEHYVAHQLLVKMHPGIRGLALAAVRMAKQCTGNKAYGWLRRRHARAVAAANTGRKHSQESRAKRSSALRGRKLAPEQVARMSAAQLGRANPHVAEANRKRIVSPETRAKIGAASRGVRRTFSAEHLANLARANRERVYRCTPETRYKLSISGRGRKLPPRGPEYRERMSAAKQGVKRAPLSPEQKAKISEALRAAHARKPFGFGSTQSRRGAPL